MKIGHNAEATAANLQANVAKQAQKTPGTAGDEIKRNTASAAAGVPVTFSPSARAMDQTSRSSGEFDASKVKAMREAIANGTFTVNAGAVADKLLADTQDILRSTQH